MRIVPLAASASFHVSVGTRISLILTTLCVLAGCAGNPPGAWREGTAISADGTKIAFYAAGNPDERPPLLVISGGPGSDHRYMHTGKSMARIARSRFVVMFDQRGTGRSERGSVPPRLADWADDVEAIRRSLGATQIDLLGHSFGGLVAMAYADQYGANARGYVFVDSSGPTLAGNKQLLDTVYPDRIGQWRETRRQLPPTFSASEIDVFFSMEFVDPAVAAEYLEAVRDYQYNIAINNELRGDLASRDYTNTMAQLTNPVKIIHGRFDAVIAPSTAWALHRLIPGSEITYIEQAGHLPFAERPNAFTQAVTEFLAGIDP